MRYAPTPPVEPGFYWIKEGDDEDIVEIWTDPASAPSDRILFVHHCGSGDATEVTSLEGALWAGPIESPDPPASGLDAQFVEGPG